MKANHTPVKYRLRQRIGKMQCRLDDAFTHRRFYPKCREYGKTNVQISIDGDKHHKGCSIQGLEAQIAYYTKLLEEVTNGHPWND